MVPCCYFLVFYFRDNFGIYKDSEIVAGHCADTSVSGDCLYSKEKVCKSALASYYRNTSLPSKVMYQSCCKVY